MACADLLDREANFRKWRGFDELEARITELWGHLNAATYRFLTWSPSSIARRRSSGTAS